MTRPIRVAVVANTLGLGGTEKTMVTHALAFDRSVVKPLVVGALAGGEREGALRAAGIDYVVAHGDAARLAEALRDTDLVHVNRAGNAEPLVPQAVRLAGVPHLIETNVFGLADRSPDRSLFDCHLFVSQMCALRYRDREKIAPDEFPRHHRVAYNPIDIATLMRLAPNRLDARQMLGLDTERPVVARVGRADDLKLSPILVDMLPHLLRRVPDVQVLLVGATDRVRKRLRSHGLSDRVVLVDSTADEERLAAFYASADVLVAASVVGESFGVAIAEAMALGVPVVTTSTPNVDNAQVEVVDPGITGYIASHPKTFSAAIAGLLHDPEKRARFGSSGAAKAARLWDAQVLTRQLERLYVSIVEQDGAPTQWLPSPDALDDFAPEYARRSVAEFIPLSRRETLEVRAANLRWRGGSGVGTLRRRLSAATRSGRAT